MKKICCLVWVLLSLFLVGCSNDGYTKLRNVECLSDVPTGVSYLKNFSSEITAPKDFEDYYKNKDESDTYVVEIKEEQDYYICGYIDNETKLVIDEKCKVIYGNGFLESNLWSGKDQYLYKYFQFKDNGIINLEHELTWYKVSKDAQILDEKDSSTLVVVAKVFEVSVSKNERFARKGYFLVECAQLYDDGLKILQDLIYLNIDLTGKHLIIEHEDIDTFNNKYINPISMYRGLKYGYKISNKDNKQYITVKNSVEIYKLKEEYEYTANEDRSLITFKLEDILDEFN